VCVESSGGISDIRACVARCLQPHGVARGEQIAKGSSLRASDSSCIAGDGGASGAVNSGGGFFHRSWAAGMEWLTAERAIKSMVAPVP